ncbi:hypothetical protein G7K_6853-t1 [Saitoella complicata NRRL Y-17804]|uniref:Uncharacterized protein n=1 Tax=Saitoella complicata (strain BCRC 22490 / CBS 7301 / JCM 7358 / NBRC 10748 / NRRL Y-17804) TaxID=698492 RepID=A0A0E9NSY2_SAICN|nr:hypothetical protein G7K_6853-t1 [Saitoella complicata NRRL Y-17804]
MLKLRSFSQTRVPLSQHSTVPDVGCASVDPHGRQYTVPRSVHHYTDETRHIYPADPVSKQMGNDLRASPISACPFRGRRGARVIRVFGGVPFDEDEEYLTTV